MGGSAVCRSITEACSVHSLALKVHVVDTLALNLLHTDPFKANVYIEVLI